jgi:hypothetical protein
MSGVWSLKVSFRFEKNRKELYTRRPTIMYIKQFSYTIELIDRPRATHLYVLQEVISTRGCCDNYGVSS